MRGGDGQEVNGKSMFWKSAGLRKTILLCFIAFFAVFIVDWRGSSLQIQAWVKASTSIDPTNYLVNQKPSVSRRALQERGSQILHGWSDDELIERAKRMEAILQMQKGGEFPEKELANLNPGASLLLPTRLGTNPNNNHKIAFMFLSASGLPLAPLWSKFFEGHETLYNIYIHTDPSWLRDYGFHQNMGVFWGRTIPSAVTHRSHANIVAAERRLIANALLDDPMNEWFILVSESCIPLRSFSNTYRMLNSSSNSFIDCGKGFPGPMMMTRYMARGDRAMLPEIPFSDFRLGSQFFAIRRRHAVMINRDTKYWSKLKLPCVRNIDSCYPDEHYVQTVIGNLDEPACHGTPTFLSWNGSKGGHPHSFGREEITPHLIEAMQATQNSRFLFARKFRWEALEPLMAYKDLLFR